MAKKRVRRSKRKSNFDNQVEKTIHGIEEEASEIKKNIKKEVHIVDRWIIERRKFLIKLIGLVGIVLALVIILKLISSFYS
jgi:hypothetical protein